MEQVEVLRAKELPCVQAAAFSGAADGSTTFVALNRCNSAVATTWPTSADDGAPMRLKSEGVTVEHTAYSAMEGNPGDYVLLSSIESADTPPWRNGPLQPLVSSWVLAGAESAALSFKLQAPPLSLSFIRVQ